MHMVNNAEVPSTQQFAVYGNFPVAVEFTKSPTHSDLKIGKMNRGLLREHLHSH